MPYLVKEDLKTHIYPEIADVITREDDSIIDNAIKAAIKEAKGYLSRFDLPKIFGTDAVDAEVDDEHLKRTVTAITCWNVSIIANPNLNLTLLRTLYEDATTWLGRVQSGKVDPEGWPYKPDVSGTSYNENNTVQSSSNRKRRNYY